MALSSKRQLIDSDYLLKRAETEVELADKATSDKAAATHHKLASAYFDRLFDDGASAEPQRKGLDVKRENQAAVSAVFGCWNVEQQNPSLDYLMQALEATTRCSNCRPFQSRLVGEGGKFRAHSSQIASNGFPFNIVMGQVADAPAVPLLLPI